MSQSSLSLSVGSKWQAKLERLVTVERVVWLLAFVLFLVAWNRGLHLLYGMFSFLLAALILSYAGAAWQLRNLSLRLKLPAEAFCLSDTEAIYEFQGKGQLLSFQIQDQDHVIESQQSVHLDSLESKKEITTHLQFNRRGCHQFEKVRISSCYPFGLVTLNKVVALEPTECVVYPKISAIRQLPSQHLFGSQVTGDIPQHKKKGEEEFAMVRQYRQGDEMRDIHWRMSAKYNEWVVKEFDSTKTPFMAVVLNNQSHWKLENQYDTREHMLEIVASIAEKCAQDGCGLKVILDSHTYYDVQPFQRDLQPLMYQLAMWQGDEVSDAPAQLTQLDSCPVILTFSNSIDGPNNTISLMPHQHQIDFRFDQDSYMGTGIKRGLSRKVEGRTTRIDITRTTSLWGVFS